MILSRWHDASLNKLNHILMGLNPGAESNFSIRCGDSGANIELQVANLQPKRQQGLHSINFILKYSSAIALFQGARPHLNVF